MGTRAVLARLLATRAQPAAGPVRGPLPRGRLSKDIRYRGESVLESVRAPRRAREPIRRWKVLRGDVVEVISGADAGRRGRVIEVVRAANRVLVEGVGFVSKELPADASGKARRVRTEGPVHVSNVMLVCPKTSRPTKVGYAFLAGGTRVRVAKVSGAVIPRPEILAKRRKPITKKDGPKDTPPSVVTRVTYKDENNLYEAYEGFAKVIERSGLV